MNLCCFCKRRKINNHFQENWKSNITIDFCGEIILFTSVCPECRKKHTIEELYKKMFKEVNE